MDFYTISLFLYQYKIIVQKTNKRGKQIKKGTNKRQVNLPSHLEGWVTVMNERLLKYFMHVYKLQETISISK